MRHTFSVRGSRKVLSTGSGRTKMAISVAMFPAARVYHWRPLGMHEALMLMFQKPDMGRHLKMMRQSCNVPHTPTIASRTRHAVRTFGSGNIRR